MELRPEVKEIFERHINLIETEQWDTFFTEIQETWVPQIVGKVAETLEHAGIFPIPHMTFIPEGYYCLSQLTEFETPSNIQRVCYKAFYAADIEKLHITGNVYDINEQAFIGCDFLKSVYIDEGVSYIDSLAFGDCDDLSTVVLPRSLKNLGHNVFDGCNNLTQLTYNGTIDEWKSIRNHGFINEGCYIHKIICSNGTIEL